MPASSDPFLEDDASTSQRQKPAPVSRLTASGYVTVGANLSKSCTAIESTAVVRFPMWNPRLKPRASPAMRLIKVQSDHIHQPKGETPLSIKEKRLVRGALSSTVVNLNYATYQNAFSFDPKYQFFSNEFDDGCVPRIKV